MCKRSLGFVEGAGAHASESGLEVERGRLQAIAVDPDGAASSYRIVAPRQFILQASFDL